MNRLERTYLSCVNALKKQSLTPKFTISDFKGRNVRYPVQCDICGTLFTTGFNIITRCPSCKKVDISNKRFLKSYYNALNTCRKNSLQPLFSKEDWKGCTFLQKTMYYLVKCSCGQEYLTWFSGDKCVKCPNCHSGNVSSKTTRYLRVLKHCEDANVAPLFTDLEYLGARASGKSLYYPVKCNLCGTEFKTSFSGRVTCSCPKCFDSRAPKNSYQQACFRLKDSGLIPLFSESEWCGCFSDTGPHHYKVSCSKCGTVFYAAVSKHWVTNCPTCTKGNHRSKLELIIEEWLKSKKIECWCNTHSLGLKPLKGKHLEIDLYIPSLKIAFEFNGSYYHSKHDKDYHLHKTKECLKKGILLYHLWDYLTTPEVLRIISAVISGARLLTRAVIYRGNDIIVNRDLCPTAPTGYLIVEEIAPSRQLINGFVCWNTGKLVIRKV